LAGASFDDPGDVVSWMGAIQAQDYGMSKWAVGVRLRSALGIDAVEKAFNDGRILRTHVMRPTWHLVSPANIRWMLKLTAEHIKSCARSRDRKLEITESIYTKTNNLIENILRGHRALNLIEIASELIPSGIVTDETRMNHLILRAEIEGIVCSGVIKRGKPTYSLLEERVPPARELSVEESLARLADIYFRSHSPAGVYDFAWWSGMSIARCRQAIDLIKSSLIMDQWYGRTTWVHQSAKVSPIEGQLYTLPAFDEYVIGYKERSSVLEMSHYHDAISAQGVFYPFIVYDGVVIGRWRKYVLGKVMSIEPSFFSGYNTVSREMFDAASERCKRFHDRL
jgi:hypothetical protein